MLIGLHAMLVCSLLAKAKPQVVKHHVIERSVTRFSTTAIMLAGSIFVNVLLGYTIWAR